MLGIAVALLIGALSVKWYNIPELANLLSFGLTLSSLVLAIIAIIQALVSNNAFAGIIGSVTTAIDQVRNAAAQIDQASNQLLRHTAAIPSALGEMSTRIDQVLNSPSVPIAVRRYTSDGDTEISPLSKGTQELINRSTNGAVLSFYICILSRENNKSFDSDEIFTNNTGYASYVAGFVAALKSTNFIDVEMVDNKAIVRSIEIIDAEIVKTAAKEFDASETMKEWKDVVDKYFLSS
jgi:hypothetical protein